MTVSEPSQVQGVTCERRKRGDHEYICDHCGSLWTDLLHETGWLPLSCPDRAANAAFIVRAVNSHEVFVKALEKIAALDPPRTDLIGAVKLARHIAKCALASARARTEFSIEGEIKC